MPTVRRPGCLPDHEIALAMLLASTSISKRSASGSTSTAASSPSFARKKAMIRATCGSQPCWPENASNLAWTKVWAMSTRTRVIPAKLPPAQQSPNPKGTDHDHQSALVASCAHRRNSCDYGTVVTASTPASAGVPVQGLAQVQLAQAH